MVAYQTVPDGYTVLRFGSHRARTRSGVAGQNSPAIAVYSFRRGATGGYYALPEDAAKSILARKIPGVGRLCGPYDDLLRCW